MDTDQVLIPGLVTGGAFILVLITLAVWVARAPVRARAAALEAFTPFARRFGVALAPGSGVVMAWLALAGPGGRVVTVGAELVQSGSPMNDEPGAWVRKTLTWSLWILGSVLVLLVVLLLLFGGAGGSTSNNQTSRGFSMRLRRTTIAVPLAPYFAGLVVKAKHGLWNRLFAGGSWLSTGDAAFDDAFWAGGPFEQARAVLTPPVRAALLAFLTGHGRFAIDGGRLIWSRRTYSTEGLEAVLDGISRLTATLG